MLRGLGEGDACSGPESRRAARFWLLWTSPPDTKKSACLPASSEPMQAAKSARDFQDWMFHPYGLSQGFRIIFMAPFSRASNMR